MLKSNYGFKLRNEKDYIAQLRLNPDNIHARLRLADLYLRKKKKQKALEQYKTVAEKLQMIGKTHSAFAIFKLIYNIDPHWQDIEELLFQKKANHKLLSTEKFCESELKKILKQVELFKGLNDSDIEQLCGTVEIRKFLPGETIIRQGEEGDSIFIILQGSVKVYYNDEIGKILELSYLTKGDFFGEMGFFGNNIRRASVDSVDESIIIELKKADVDNLIKKHRNIEEILLKFYKERILDLIVATTPIFYPLDVDVRKELVKNFNLKKYRKGEFIIKEGESSDAMFIIKSGKVAVEKNGQSLAELGPSDFFGEIGLVTGQKRTADIIALTDVELMELKKSDVDVIISKYPEVLEILKDFIHQRTSDTFSKLMELKRLSAKKGLV